ncbi:hypothetical protein [Rhodocyclus gracilis]|uniref:Uncharacterized protein n=1 Tax=Rhodocyclus tenuis TaxID=1066 RepID=A0A6L5JXX0_RHOTE|nr:hypothetical protein [Rhodocyclus gracilis]MQY52069.1 hypothetical protein [Rhodocyclus gracilis]
MKRFSLALLLMVATLAAHAVPKTAEDADGTVVMAPQTVAPRAHAAPVAVKPTKPVTPTAPAPAVRSASAKPATSASSTAAPHHPAAHPNAASRAPLSVHKPGKAHNAASLPASRRHGAHANRRHKPAPRH